MMASDEDQGSGDAFPVPYFMTDNMLKPQLDSIFEEVQKNLPTIDFEISDVRTCSYNNVLSRLCNV